MLNKIIIIGGTVVFVFLGGCAKKPDVDTVNHFINANRVVTKTVHDTLPTPAIKATFHYGNNPAVIKAYNVFSKAGKAKTIQSPGFLTLPYDGYSHPIISCAPLHLCVVQLEQGETINNIELGDSAHWLVSTALVGTQQHGSYQIAIKPKQYRLATDMVITTNKRTYNIGLVSKAGAYTHVATFYYPEETLQQAVAVLHRRDNARQHTAVIDSRAKVDVNQLNFNYRLHGHHPAWRPLQVFDDGNKTYIRMPALTAHVNLPVLYVWRSHAMQLVNYRYQRPFYIIDALFQRAILVSGKGHHATKVVIENRQWV